MFAAGDSQRAAGLRVVESRHGVHELRRIRIDEQGARDRQARFFTGLMIGGSISLVMWAGIIWLIWRFVW